MLTFLLRLFAVVIFALLAFKVLNTDTLQWAYGASAAFVASFLVTGYGPPSPIKQ
jgi:hypothetical protein